ncbi:MAG TPA: aminoacetone oxidase family FAD-binding enzyme, partial [Myxococcota bacterium]|nr:aminoacetone oxidase family FAD-binding enzyme [Myxococcota bacterium]
MQEQGAAPWPLVVIGAGAAGLLAAIFAGRRGIPVLMLDTRRQPGAKIRVSGGSRCNVLPSRAALEDFHTSGSHKALRNILFSWPLSEVHDFFQRELGVPLKTEPTGKVFPVSDRSKDVVDALLGEAARVGVCLRGQARVAALRVAGDGFELTLEGGEPILARRVVLATGGKSLPRTGSDGGGWRLASGLGHTVLPTYPALVPLLTPDPAWRALAGVALPVSLQAERAGRPIASVAGDFLFTHTGFSGPAALDISRHFAAPGGGDVALVARWSALDGPGWEQALARDGARPVAPLVREHLP